jgi:hypothetical protein
MPYVPEGIMTTLTTLVMIAFTEGRLMSEFWKTDVPK